MATTHEHTMPLTINVGGDELEITAEIQYTIRAGNADSWECPGDPAEIEFEKIEITAPRDFDANWHKPALSDAIAWPAQKRAEPS